MLIRSVEKRWSCFVPVMLLLFAGGLSFVSFERLHRLPSLGVGVTCLLMVGLVAFVLADVTFASERGPNLRVRKPFGSRELDAGTLVISVVTSQGARGGVRYEVIAADASGQRVMLAELWTKRGAEHARERLAETFERLEANRGRERVRRGLDQEQAEVDAQQAAAMAQVKKYYESGTHRRTLLFVVAALVLYVLGMAVYVLSTGGTL